MYLPKSVHELSIAEKVISFRHVKEALEEAFTVNFEENSAYCLRGKIVRMVRTYGGPIIWPSASIEVEIDNNKEILKYTVYWPDYYMVIVMSLLILIGFGSGEFEKESLTLLVTLSLFAWFLIFLDTRYVMGRINKYLLKQIKAT